MPITTTNWSNVNNVSGVLQAANTNTGGFFWTSILWMIYAIMLISMLPFGFGAAAMSAAFACLMLGIVLVYMGLVSWVWVITFAGILVFGFIWAMYSQRD